MSPRPGPPQARTTSACSTACAPPPTPAPARSGRPPRNRQVLPIVRSGTSSRSKVFDNLYFVGENEYSAWAVTTSAGIILIDAIFDYSVEDEVVDGLKKLGLDPATIKYVIVSHGHRDHVGGARLLQERFGARVMHVGRGLGSARNTAGSWPKPTRDMVATDGQRLTLGDTTVTMYLTPGHTLGTISTLIPVKDGGTAHTAAAWGGTAFNWTTNRAAYITPERPDRFWFETYIASARALPRHRREERRRRADRQPHQLRWHRRPSCRRSRSDRRAPRIRTSSAIRACSAI